MNEIVQRDMNRHRNQVGNGIAVGRFNGFMEIWLGEGKTIVKHVARAPRAVERKELYLALSAKPKLDELLKAGYTVYIDTNASDGSTMRLDYSKLTFILIRRNGEQMYRNITWIPEL